jgi:hypothetical protein
VEQDWHYAGAPCQALTSNVGQRDECSGRLLDMKSESEEFCKSCLDKYLRELLPDSDIVWEDVEKRYEPPEFYLTIDSATYAVEVTILIQKADVGTKKPLPIGIIRDLLRKFVIDEVETTAKENHFLRGAYLVTFSKPITNFTHVKGAIQDALLSYICATQGVSKASPRVIYECGRQKCSIEKVHAEEDKVVMGGPIISRREDEALAEAQQLLDNRLSEKEYRLREINSPKILLLHNKYHFAEFQTYKKYISMAPSLSSFQAVLLVESNGIGIMLYSKEPAWMPGD